MSPSREVDDGPAVLQLYRWKRSQPLIELSKFREAFISPTRRLFGLLLDHGDLVLSTVDVNPSQVESPIALSDTCSMAVFEGFSSIPRGKICHELTRCLSHDKPLSYRIVPITNLLLMDQRLMDSCLSLVEGFAFEHQQLSLEATGVEFNAIKAAYNSEITKVKRVGVEFLNEANEEIKSCWTKPTPEVQQSIGLVTFSLTNGPAYHISQICLQLGTCPYSCADKKNCVLVLDLFL